MKITTKDNFSLDVTFNSIKNSKKIVIFAHGMTVARNDEGIFCKAEKILNKNNISSIKFDFRAHGKSQGDSTKDFTIKGELIDLDTIVKYVKKQNFDDIGLAAASFGGGIATLYAGNNPDFFKSLFLANPCLNYVKNFLQPTTKWAQQFFKHLDQRLEKKGYIIVGSRQFKIGKPLFDDMKRYFPCKKLQNFNKDILIVHGQKDQKISYQDVKSCYNQLNNPKAKLELIPNAHHGFHRPKNESKVAKMISNFFLRTL